jgi:polyisoprenoid-binding protein YceI
MSVLLSLMLLTMTGSSSTTKPYTVDNSHSSVIFRIKHLNVSYTYGRFNEISGTFLLDEADPTKSSVAIEIKTNSLDTNSADRDKHLKSPDFFNVKQFPTATFKSTSVKAADAGKYEVTGDLTILGVTKPVTFTLTKTGEGDTPFKDHRLGFETNLTIKRSDFGMKFMPEMLEDNVWLLISVEGVRK